MSLQEELNQYRLQERKQIPLETQQVISRSIEELKYARKHYEGLAVGDTAPDFTLSDASGKKVTLSILLKNGPVVLNFYRGGWCPYCNLELNALQRNMPAFKKLGAQLIAISPESPDNSLNTKQKHALEFSVLSDLKSDVARKYGIVYRVPDYLKSVFEKFGLDLKAYNQADDIELPIPASYVIDKNRVIRYAFASEDFTIRADIQEILRVLQQLHTTPRNSQKPV
jgi:peroxiredoxin